MHVHHAAKLRITLFAFAIFSLLAASCCMLSGCLPFASSHNPYEYRYGAAPTEAQLKFADEVMEPVYTEDELAEMAQGGMDYHDWYNIVPGEAALRWVREKYPDYTIKPYSVSSSFPPGTCTLSVKITDGPGRFPTEIFDVKVYYKDGVPSFSEELAPLLSEGDYDARVREVIEQSASQVGVDSSCLYTEAWVRGTSHESNASEDSMNNVLESTGEIRCYISPRTELSKDEYADLVAECVTALKQSGAKGTGTTWLFAYLAGFDENMIGGYSSSGPFSESAIKEVFSEWNQGMRDDPRQWTCTGVL